MQSTEVQAEVKTLKQVIEMIRSKRFEKYTEEEILGFTRTLYSDISKLPVDQQRSQELYDAFRGKITEAKVACDKARNYSFYRICCVSHLQFANVVSCKRQRTQTAYMEDFEKKIYKVALEDFKRSQNPHYLELASRYFYDQETFDKFKELVDIYKAQKEKFCNSTSSDTDGKYLSSVKLLECNMLVRLLVLTKDSDLYSNPERFITDGLTQMDKVIHTADLLNVWNIER